jgi:hypothetical protein
MYSLSNDLITVNIVDPNKDFSLLGSRYCTGGYIWQIIHKKFGELLRGPCFPQKNPPVFDGQGAPEVFESPAHGADFKPIGSTVLVPGVGMVRKTSSITPFHVRDNPEVIDFCKWNITCSASNIVMTTTQSLDSFECSITREIVLIESTIVSSTLFHYSGRDPFSLIWFAHPFFPLNSDFKCCRFSVPLKQLSSDAFTIDQKTGLLGIRPEFDYSKSSYTLLDIPSGQEITVEQFHPDAGKVTISTDFPVSKMPVWTNKNTFSFEPYFQTVITNSESISWSIKYVF